MASAEADAEPRLFAPSKKRRKNACAGQRAAGSKDTQPTAVRSVTIAEQQSTPTPAGLASSPSDRDRPADAAGGLGPSTALRSSASGRSEASDAPDLDGTATETGAEVSPAAAVADAAAATEEPPAPLPVADTTFRELGVSEWLDRVCRSLGMTKPTQVQAGCIPAILAGRNAIGTAHTGSGKTAAFALPILQLLAADPYGVFALVLTPTR